MGLSEINDRIAKAEQEAGRVGQTTLIAVSKVQPP